jgi:hypothetical protein
MAWERILSKITEAVWVMSICIAIVSYTHINDLK